MPGPCASTPVEFADWVEARGAALQRFAHLVTGGAADVPDLVQDALAQVWPRWSSLSRSGTADAYARRCIVNAAISRWRKDRRVVVTDDVGAFHRATEDPTAATADSDAAWALVLELPAAQRAAVVLRFYEDLAYREIALILDCAEATARSHVNRALAALRSRLQEDVDA